LQEFSLCNNTDDPFSQSDLTQTISDSQFNDDDMYRIIQSKFGQLDRTNFKRELLQNTEAEDLKPIRNSLLGSIFRTSFGKVNNQRFLSK
jgi:hypothetical protein